MKAGLRLSLMTDHQRINLSAMENRCKRKSNPNKPDTTQYNTCFIKVLCPSKHTVAVVLEKSSPLNSSQVDLSEQCSLTDKFVRPPSPR